MITAVHFSLQFNITLHDRRKTTKLKFDFKHAQLSKCCRCGTVSPKHTCAIAIHRLCNTVAETYVIICVSLRARSRMTIFSFLSPSGG